MLLTLPDSLTHREVMQTDTKVGLKPGVGEAGKEKTNKSGLRTLVFTHLFFYIQKKKKEKKRYKTKQKNKNPKTKT